MGILENASVVPLTSEEIKEATAIIDKQSICVATVQLKMQIGWNLAADLIEHTKGRQALPAIALNR